MMSLSGSLAAEPVNSWAIVVHSDNVHCELFECKIFLFFEQVSFLNFKLNLNFLKIASRSSPF